ncbi:MAG: D-xylose 1-dehydrogenase D-xylono,5-lactone-forming [Chloroflexia bacterium]|jgi:predicted dehydrogenase|nr:D-xylose 1-dehydrogenase D-xylono,5-lactone-forming [Chloroflexia bacterium]
MPGDKLRWGVLGTARIADTVIPGLLQASNSELVAVASRDAEKAREWAQARGLQHYFSSYDEMLASDLIDAVYIPLPNALHVEWSIRAIERGKHVLCEKPISTQASHVEELIAAQQSSGVKVMEAFMYRFHPQTQRIRQLVYEGAIGEARIVRATFDFLLSRANDVRLSKELGGGSLLDVGCYCVNISTLVTGMPPKAVTASAVWAENGVDTSLVGTLEFPNGMLGVIDCSFQVGTSMQQGLEVSGTGGLIRVEQPFRMSDEDTTITVDKADKDVTVQRVRVPGGNEYRFMVEHFADAVLNDTELSYTLEDSLANMRVLDALIEAARTGRRVGVAGTSAG